MLREGRVKFIIVLNIEAYIDKNVKAFPEPQDINTFVRPHKGETTHRNTHFMAHYFLDQL